MAPSATSPRPLPTGAPTAGRDELDDLFDYDVELEELFGDKPTAANKDATATGNSNSESTSNGNKNARSNGLGLGLDEEVVIEKKPRVPRVKLDEERLRSKAGISKLRERAKNLKFKGKGHEYSDTARLLQLYQLWLDDLFPKAKFLDAAAMIEKLGHKRHVQMMRQGWIDEGKPRDSSSFRSEAAVQQDGVNGPGVSVFDDPTLLPRGAEDGNGVAGVERPRSGGRLLSLENRDGGSERLKTPAIDEDLDEDLYGATPMGRRARNDGNGNVDGQTANQENSIFGPKKDNVNANANANTGNDEPEDDLDALLAEQEMQDVVSGAGPAERRVLQPEPDFDDEMEAMYEMGD